MVVLCVQFGLLLVLLLQLLTVSSQIGTNLSKHLLESSLGNDKHANLTVEGFLQLFENYLVLHHLRGELVHLVLVLALHQGQLVVQESTVR